MKILDKKITKTNYTLFTIIFIFTIVLGMVVYMLYNSYKNNRDEISAIKDKVNVISLKNITEYINENKVVYLYLNTSQNKIRVYEEEMLRIANEKNITISYLDMGLVSDKKTFIKKLNSKYSQDLTIKKYPSLILIEDNKIIKIVEEKDRKLNSRDMIELFNYLDKEALND